MGLTVLLVVLGVIGYWHIGYQLGDMSLKIWLAKDNASFRSFLLFPVSHHTKKVGAPEDSAPALISGFNLEKTRGEGYKLLMIFIWPLKLLWNIPALVLYGAIDGVSAVARAIHQARAAALEKKIKDDAATFPSADDDVHALFAKRQEVVSRMQQLAARRRTIDEELERRKTEMDAVFEVEGNDDPDVRQLIAPKKESA